MDWIAYPTQFRTSSVLCRSQVFDEAVMSTRMNRVPIGWSLSFRVTVPPDPACTAPEANTVHLPSGPRSKSSASLPSQYSTRYLVAYGFSQAIRTPFTPCSAFKSTTTHCGCDSSDSPVNLPVRYGLLFQ